MAMRGAHVEPDVMRSMPCSVSDRGNLATTNTGMHAVCVQYASGMGRVCSVC